jgi:hypothetical protein
MTERTERTGLVGAELRADERALGRGNQAFKLLHFAFIVLPTIAGLDKFLHLLANWDLYLASQIKGVLPFDSVTFMQGVGVFEMALGLLIALKPRIGAYVLSVWLAVYIVDLLLLGNSFAVAFLVFGLLLCAVALGRLSSVYERGRRLSSKPAVP